MKIEVAVRKSIKNFMSGKLPEKTGDMKEEGLFYTPEFFDALEDKLVGKVKEKEEVDG